MRIRVQKDDKKWGQEVNRIERLFRLDSKPLVLNGVCMLTANCWCFCIFKAKLHRFCGTRCSRAFHLPLVRQSPVPNLTPLVKLVLLCILTLKITHINKTTLQKLILPPLKGYRGFLIKSKMNYPILYVCPPTPSSTYILLSVGYRSSIFPQDFISFCDILSSQRLISKAST